jgi:hypothetical protein
MGLEGSIEDFGLADILQLLYFQKKTGLLTVDGRLGRIKVYFLSGNIVAAESKKKMEEKRIGKILVKKGLLTEEKLREVLEKKKSTRSKIGSLLVKEGLVSKENVEEIIVNQLTEIVVQLFNWKKGTYDFKAQKVQPDRELDISVDTQHLLMDGLRIVDELAVIDEKVTLDTVFERTKVKGLELTEEEQKVFDAINGENDVSALVESSGEDEYKVSKILVSLLDKDAIQPLEQKEFVAVTPEKVRGPRISILSVLANLILIASFVISLNPILIEKQNTKIIQAEKDLRKIMLAVEVEKIDNGSYPGTLDGMETATLDPWNNKYSYKKTKTGYELKSPGPDGIPNTADDIY